MTETAEKIFINVDFNKQTEFLGRSIESGLPVTAPLRDLEDLLAWEPDDSDDAGQKFSVGTVPFCGKKIPKGSPKTLVCHDMAGGYIDDRFVQGTVCEDDKWYYLAYWDVIDTFVYFSHHFVTIPPVGWINCAHTNGVAVLGTFITEWKDGYKRCKAFLTCDFMWKAVAEKLVGIAKYYRFEGWLVNIENQIKPEHIGSLKKFLQYLSDQMHAAVPGSQVIWYDSVTKDGDLSWQNELNGENRTFFEACDGIFLNYGWSAKTLKDSADLASLSHRAQDVYVGVDVFGRGCYGGGGMNCGVALQVIRRHGLSAAIFAPGWVKEVLGSKDFEENQKKFWDSISPYCSCHELLSGSKNFVATNFETGMSTTGQKKLRNLHLQDQQVMPSLSLDAFQALPLVEIGSKRCVAVTPKKNCVLCRTRLEVPSGRLLLVVEDNCGGQELELTLKVTYTNSGEGFSSVKIYKHGERGSSSTGSPQVLLQGDNAMVVLPPFIFHELSCEALVRVTAIYGLALYPMPAEAEGDMENPVQVNPIKIRVTDVTWEKSTTDPKHLLLSCTLELDNVEKVDMVNISYRFNAPKYQFLGSSACERFRVNKLSVPNPVFHGLSAKLFVKAEQKCIVPMPHSANRVGVLEINYCENVRDVLLASS